MLPRDYGNWNKVYSQLKRWRKTDIFEKILSHLNREVRIRRNSIFADNGHAISKDGTKRGAKGYDGGKKIKGRKRAIISCTLGLIHAVHVCSASEHDTKLAEPLLEKIVGKFPRLRKILADRGFSCDHLRRFVTLKLNALLEIKDNKEGNMLQYKEKSVPLKGFQVIPHRWIV